MPGRSRLQLACANGDPIEMGMTAEAFGVRQTTVAEYAARVFGKVAEPVP